MNVYYQLIENQTLSKKIKELGIVLPNLNRGCECISFGAFIGKNIIGSILLETLDNKNFTVNIFVVLPMFRNLEIGSTLLKIATKYCKDSGGVNIIIKCNTSDHVLDLVNSFLTKNQLKNLKYEYTKYRIKIEKFQTYFINKFFYGSSKNEINNYNIYYLNELSRDQINKVNQKAASVDNTYLLSDNLLNIIIPELSLFVMNNNEFIAWCVLEEENDTEISISHTYIDKKYRSYEFCLQLWNIIFRKYIKNESYKKYKYISFLFQKSNLNLLRLYSLLFGKYIEKEIEYFRTFKYLN